MANGKTEPKCWISSFHVNYINCVRIELHNGIEISQNENVLNWLEWRIFIEPKSTLVFKFRHRFDAMVISC